MNSGIPALRPLLGGVAISLAVAAASAAILPVSAEPTPLVACPGGAELLASAAVRLWPTAPLGVALLTANKVILIAGLALFVVLLRRVCGAWTIAVALSLACATLPTFGAALTVPRATGLLVSAAAAFALLSLDRPASTRRLSVALATLLATVAIFPVTTLPVAIAAAWIAARTRTGASRLTWLLAVSFALLAVGTTVVMASPVLPVAGASELGAACLVAPLRRLSLRGIAPVVMGVATEAGTYVCALAALGLFSIRGRLFSERARPVALYLVAMAIAAVSPLADRTAVAPPLLVATWMLAGLGLREMIHACGPGPGGRLAAAGLLVLVPALQWSERVKDRSVHAPEALRHARVSLEGLRGVLQHMPPGAALVQEDALVELLLRARSRDSVAAAMPLLLPREPRAIATWLSAGRVAYALPIAQSQLQFLGIRVHDVPEAPGLAAIEIAGTCHVLGPDWRVLPELSASAFALAARSPAESGPVVFYAEFDDRPAPHALQWPALATRGFHVTSYDTSEESGRARLDRDVRVDDVPDQYHPAARHVVRLEQWRTPGSPLVLATGLGRAPARVVAHVLGGSEPGRPTRRITVCPAYPHDVQPIHISLRQ